MPKTVWIVPKETLSGGRCDGRPWPPAGTPIDIPDWEAEHAVNAGWAYYYEPPAADPDPGAVREPAAEAVLEAGEAGHPAGDLAPEPPAAKDAHAPVQEPVPDPVPVPEPEDEDPDPPRPSDPKQDWVDYAQSRGMSPVTAAAMSKADLMSRFGGRL